VIGPAFHVGTLIIQLPIFLITKLILFVSLSVPTIGVLLGVMYIFSMMISHGIIGCDHVEFITS